MAGPPYTFGSFVINDGVSYILMEKPYDVTPWQQSYFKLARLEGVKRTGDVVNQRQITLKIKVIGVSRVDLEQKLEALYQGLAIRQQPLQIYAADNRYFVADCTSIGTTLVGGLPISVVVTATFTCVQPYAFASVVSHFSSGVLFPISNIAGAYTFQPQVIAGGGSVYSRPELHLKQTGGVAQNWTQVTVTQTTDNQFIQVTGSPYLITTNGATVDIYGDPTSFPNGYTVQLNASGTPIAFSGVFPQMKETLSTWSIVVTTSNPGNTPSLTANWTWTPRWLT